VQDGGKSRHGERGASNVQGAEIVKEFGKDFRKMPLGRGGECLACKGKEDPEGFSVIYPSP